MVKARFQLGASVEAGPAILDTLRAYQPRHRLARTGFELVFEPS
jgi:hypothetical protein